MSILQADPTIEAISTFAGTVVALAAFATTIILSRNEGRRRRADVAQLQAQLDQSKASQIALISWDRRPYDLGSGTVKMVLVNNSESPVFDVRVVPWHLGERVVLSDGRQNTVATRETLLPGAQLEIQLDVPYGIEGQVSAEVELRDAMDGHWMRVNNGRPRLTHPSQGIEK